MTDLVDIVVPLPEIWTCSTLDADELAEARSGLEGMLADAVGDPTEVAGASIDEFLQRIGGGSAPIMVGSFREELEDGAVLAASMIVAKNDLTGSLHPWRTAYDDAEDLTLPVGDALRTHERMNVRMAELLDEPITLLTWRYIVPFDEGSTLLFTFSSPNHELDEELIEHFDDIMSGVRIGTPEPEAHA